MRRHKVSNLRARCFVNVSVDSEDDTPLSRFIKRLDVIGQILARQRTQEQ